MERMRKLLATLAILGLLTGCELPSNNPTYKGVELQSSKDLTIGFGSVGPAKVGMTKREAMDTGVFSRARFDADKKCKASALKWKKQYKGLEVQTDKAGTIRSLRVVAPGARTQYGIQVGSDLSDVRGSYASALSGPKKIDRKHAVGFVKKDDAWIGFLFDDDPDDEVLDPIILIEVTRGSKPQLRPDC